jgi:putative endonuclease
MKKTRPSPSIKRAMRTSPSISFFVIAGRAAAQAAARVDPAIHHCVVDFWVYIFASGPGGALYTGVTRDLVRRVFEHREGLVKGFTHRYDVKLLVYHERHDMAAAAIQREKNIKHWPREWKIDLIVSQNPQWRDLYDEIAS